MPCGSGLPQVDPATCEVGCEVGEVGALSGMVGELLLFIASQVENFGLSGRKFYSQCGAPQPGSAHRGDFFKASGKEAVLMTGSSLPTGMVTGIRQDTLHSPQQRLFPRWQLKLRREVTGPRLHSHPWQIPSSWLMRSD